MKEECDKSVCSAIASAWPGWRITGMRKHIVFGNLGDFDADTTVNVIMQFAIDNPDLNRPDFKALSARLYKLREEDRRRNWIEEGIQEIRELYANSSAGFPMPSRQEIFEAVTQRRMTPLQRYNIYQLSEFVRTMKVCHPDREEPNERE